MARGRDGGNCPLYKNNGLIRVYVFFFFAGPSTKHVLAVHVLISVTVFGRNGRSDQAVTVARSTNSQVCMFINVCVSVYMYMHVDILVLSSLFYSFSFPLPSRTHSILSSSC